MAGCLGQCVGKAISKVQTSKMTALTKSPKCGAGNLDLVHIERDNFDLRSMEEQVELAPGDLAVSRFEDNAGLDRQRSNN